MPFLLLEMRCALTAPFHPYQNGGIFSVALSLGLPLLEVIQHLLSIEPGLSSLKKATTHSLTVQKYNFYVFGQQIIII